VHRSSEVGGFGAVCHFGNESVEVVRMIAALDIPKQRFWETTMPGTPDWGRKKSPHDHDKEDWVQEQLNLLGKPM